MDYEQMEESEDRPWQNVSPWVLLLLPAIVKLCQVPVPATPSTSVAQSAPISREAPVSRNQILYHERNEMVSAAAKAGKGRWGPLEVEKATQLAALPIAPSTPIAAVSSTSGSCRSWFTIEMVESVDRHLRNESIWVLNSSKKHL